MKLTKLHLHNYRNYEDFTIDFGSESTVIFGQNGTGKTNLLRAIRQLLSFIFSKHSEDPHFNFLASLGCRVIGFKQEDARYDKDKTEEEFGYHYPIRNTLTTSQNNSDELLEWTFEKDSLFSDLNESLYRAGALRFWKNYDNGKGDLPVFAYFSDSYPCLNSRLSRTIADKLRSGNPLPHNIGFYKWFEDRNNPQLWITYFMMQYKNGRFSNDTEEMEYAKAIIEVLVKSSQPISKYNPKYDFVLKDVRVDLRPTGDVMLLEYENGFQIPFTDLSTSHLRFFSMILDIASMSYLLNKNCNPTGIVLIDGLDLLLYPTEQRTILKRLRNTFSRIQWIVTTNSPLVLSSYEPKESANVIYKLSKKESSQSPSITSIGSVQGVDAFSVLKYTMDTQEDDSRLDDYKEAYEFWKAKGDKEKMENIKERIKDLVGEGGLLYQMLKE